MGAFAKRMIGALLVFFLVLTALSVVLGVSGTVGPVEVLIATAVAAALAVRSFVVRE